MQSFKHEWRDDLAIQSRPEFHPSASYETALPEKPRPIVILGAGGIVRDAHLPAYEKAGFTVAGISNRTTERAQVLADRYSIPIVTQTVADAVRMAPADAVFDPVSYTHLTLPTNREV